jgi:hypothetical protein
VKLPLCAEETFNRGPAGTVQLPMFCHPLLEFDAPAYIHTS